MIFRQPSWASSDLPHPECSMPTATPRIASPSGPYTIRWVTGHLCFETDEGLTLLDTGSPMTLHHPEFLTKFVGAPLHALLGLDRMPKRMLIDDPAGTITFGGEPRTGPSVPLLAGPMGVPLLDVIVGGVATRAVFDTGATLSYAPAEVVAHGADPERRDDFLPGVGDYRCATAIVPVRIGPWEFRMRCGVLPAHVSALVSLMGFGETIIGAELFGGRVIELDLRQRRLVMVGTGVGA